MTPAIRALEAADVDHTVHEYVHDSAVRAFGSEAAEQLGVDPDRVFKTLVVTLIDSGGHERDAVAVVPVSGQLNLKAAASALGAKRALLGDGARAERVTGYVVGGISPFGQKRALPTVVDETCARFPTVYVSAGRRGLEVEVSPADLVAMTAAVVADLAG